MKQNSILQEIDSSIAGTYISLFCLTFISFLQAGEKYNKGPLQAVEEGNCIYRPLVVHIKGYNHFPIINPLKIRYTPETVISTSRKENISEELCCYTSYNLFTGSEAET